MKHKKGPKQQQVAWGPVSVAKNIGRDWGTMTTDERGLLSDAVRFCYNQHSRIVSGHEIARAAAVIKVHDQRETYRARLAKFRQKVKRWKERMSV
jgi:hypothetical protein